MFGGLPMLAFSGVLLGDFPRKCQGTHKPVAEVQVRVT
jgi:hypothetical protein